MTTWPLDDPEAERRIARLERRGRRFSLVTIEFTIGLAIVGIWWTLKKHPLFILTADNGQIVVAVTAEYRVFQSRIAAYGVARLAVSIGLWLLLSRFTGVRVATLLVGLVVILAGLALAFSRIPTGGRSASCRSLMSSIGRSNDERGECVNPRTARTAGVVVALTSGLVIFAVGSDVVTNRSR